MLFKKKENKGLNKRLAIYISDKHQHIIIAPMHMNKAEITYEQETCTVLGLKVSSFDFGAEVINNLNLFSIRDVNLRDKKTTDWPAFKHSKSKSIISFESDYIYILVECKNESNNTLSIRGIPYVSSEISINSIVSIHADKSEIGEKVLKVYEACSTLNK